MEGLGYRAQLRPGQDLKHPLPAFGFAGFLLDLESGGSLGQGLAITLVEGP